MAGHQYARQATTCPNVPEKQSATDLGCGLQLCHPVLEERQVVREVKALDRGHDVKVPVNHESVWERLCVGGK